MLQPSLVYIQPCQAARQRGCLQPAIDCHQAGLDAHTHTDEVRNRLVLPAPLPPPPQMAASEGDLPREKERKKAVFGREFKDLPDEFKMGDPKAGPAAAAAPPGQLSARHAYLVDHIDNTRWGPHFLKYCKAQHTQATATKHSCGVTADICCHHRCVQPCTWVRRSSGRRT